MPTENNARAEFVALQLKDGFENHLIRMDGKSCKGYCEDILSVDEYPKRVRLTRNGIMHSLPEGLFSHEDFLRNAKEDDLHEQLEKLHELRENCAAYFEIFDTRFFAEGISLQKVVDTTEKNIDALLLKFFYGENVAQILDNEDPVKRHLVLLLLIRNRIKGDIDALAFYLSLIFKKKTIGNTIYRRLNNNSATLVKYVQFIVYFDGLSHDECVKKMKIYKDYFDFINDWFIPFDCTLEYYLRDTHQPFAFQEHQCLTLGYNTHFKSKK